MSASTSRQRPHQIGIRVSAEERTELQRRAAEARLSVGGYLRHTILATKPPRQSRIAHPDRALLARCLGQLGKIGGNINFLAREARTGGWPTDEDLAEASQDVKLMRHLLMRALGVEVSSEDDLSDEALSRSTHLEVQSNDQAQIDAHRPNRGKIIPDWTVSFVPANATSYYAAPVFNKMSGVPEDDQE